MTDETIKAAYQFNIRGFEVLFSVSNVFSKNENSRLAWQLYKQADNHRKYMRRAVLPKDWLQSRGL